jgi:acyl carrier protein
MDSHIVSPLPPSATTIQDWIVAWLARELPLPEDSIDPFGTFESLGASSLQVVLMTGELADWLGREVDPAAVYDYPTIAAFATHIESRLEYTP